MTLIAIALCVQCCLRHVVGQQMVSDVSVVRSCWSRPSLFVACLMNLIGLMLIRLLIVCIGLCPLDIWSVSALQVSRNRALQIDIYLVTYLLTWNAYFALHTKHTLPHNMASCTWRPLVERIREKSCKLWYKHQIWHSDYHGYTNKIHPTAATWKSKMAAIFQDGRQSDVPKIVFALDLRVFCRFRWFWCQFLCFLRCWIHFSSLSSFIVGKVA